MDPDVPIAELSTLASYVSNAMSQTRFLLALIGAFAVMALGLASLGLYGVISYSAKQRTREIGVRVALGASERDVMGLILGQGLAVALAGIGLGLAGAVALSRVVSAFLVGVSATNPITFAGVAALLLAVAIVASFVPARRASRVESGRRAAGTTNSVLGRAVSSNVKLEAPPGFEPGMEVLQFFRTVHEPGEVSESR